MSDDQLTLKKSFQVKFSCCCSQELCL